MGRRGKGFPERTGPLGRRKAEKAFLDGDKRQMNRIMTEKPRQMVQERLKGAAFLTAARGKIRKKGDAKRGGVRKGAGKR